MAWTLLEQHQQISSADYRARIQMAFLNTAQNVITEDPQTPNHAARLVLAEQVIEGDGLPRRAVDILHVLNPGLQVENPTDSDILFTVSQQWDYFADVVI